MCKPHDDCACGDHCPEATLRSHIENAGQEDDGETQQHKRAVSHRCQPKHEKPPPQLRNAYCSLVGANPQDIQSNGSGEKVSKQVHTLRLDGDDPPSREKFPSSSAGGRPSRLRRIAPARKRVRSCEAGSDGRGLRQTAEHRGAPATDCDRGENQSSSLSALTKASWGMSTEPIDFIRFLPSFCFLSSLFFRVTSPP